MDQATYQRWWQWHLRIARGETLAPDERRSYDAGRRELEREEQFPQAADAREARETLVALEKERAQLEEQRQQLESEIVDLESRLGEQTRQFLGVED